MRILRTSAGLAAVGMIGLVVSAATPADASTTRPSPSLAVPGANAQSTRRAGYKITTAPAKSAASADFTVPTVSGCKVGHDSGIAAASLVFTGTATAPSVSGVGVLIQCTSGSPAFQAVAIVNGAATPLSVTVAPDDAVSMSVTVTKSKVTVNLKDTTKHFNKTLTGTGAVPAVVLDGIDTLMLGTTVLPVPKLSTITFTKGKMDGKTPKLAGAVAVDLVTATTPKKVRILTGKLSTTGDSWTETFKHA